MNTERPSAAVTVTEQALEGAILAQLLAETADPNCGALVVFGGTVRLDERVVAIDYSAYAPLAVKTLLALEQETMQAFPDVRRLRIIHRTGLLAVGELSVLMVLRSGHRKQGFAAAAWAMDQLKARVPVWKQEHYQDGSKEFLPGQSLLP